MICPDCKKGNIDGAKRCSFCSSYFNSLSRLFDWASFFRIVFSVVIGILVGVLTTNYSHYLAKEKYLSEVEQARKEEYARLLVLLQKEFEFNCDVLKHNDEWVQKDVGWLEKEEREKGSLEKANSTLIDLIEFQFFAWEVAKSSPTFLNSFKDEELSLLFEFYSKLYHLNTMAIKRDAFRINVFGMNWMALTLKNQNNNITAFNREMEPYFIKVGNFLYKNEEWMDNRKLLW